MRPWRVFRITSYTWRVFLVENVRLGTTECDGLCDPANQTILLRKGMGKQRRYECLWHELAHAMEFCAGLDLPEAKIELLGQYLAQLAPQMNKKVQEP